MRRSIYLLLSLTVLFGSAAAYADFGAQGLYGIPSDVWTKVDALKATDLGTAEIQVLLDNSFDHPQEGIVSASVHSLNLLEEGSLHDLFSQSLFGLRFDLLEGGSIRNRILPDVRGYLIRTGSVDFDLVEALPFEKSGWTYSAGSVIGLGEQKTVSGSAIDFFSSVPIQSSVLFYSGLNFTIGRQQHYDNNVRTFSLLTFRPNYFHANFSQYSSDLQTTNDLFTFRWKLAFEWTVSLDSPMKAGAEAGVQTIGGPQPIPKDILPRTWDEIHQVKPFPVFGSTVGLGGVVRLFSDQRKYMLELLGGYYGGYFGAGAEARLWKFVLAAGTWGVEQTTNYRMAESRIEYLSLGFRHDF
jgi:hypothetical protein